MLKLKQNLVPEGDIDGVNTQFKTPEIIGAIQSIYVDGVMVDIDGFSSDILTIDLVVAPAATIVVNYFYRELSAVSGTGEITLGNLKTEFYRKIGRVNEDGSVPTNINRLYPETYVKSELNKSIRRIGNMAPGADRVQEYSFSTQTGYEISDESDGNTVTFEEKLTNEISGVFLIEKGVMYEYYGLIDNSFQTADIDLSEIGDRIIVGHRVPYGVQRVSSIKVEGQEYKYMNEREFNMNCAGRFTIIKDFQGNEYLFFPYSEAPLTYNIKYIPDVATFSTDDDIVNIPFEYTDLFIYDVAYRLLRDKEDDRWVSLREEIGNGTKYGLMYEYKTYLRSKRKGYRPNIGFAKTIK